MVEIGGGRMRDILFRGKRVDNGEWVYGAYITMHHNDGRTHIHHFIIPDGSDLSYGVKVEDILVEVDGETVCQYTGITDKNGKKIFESDIVRSKRFLTNNEYVYCRIVYRDSAFFVRENKPGVDYIFGEDNNFEVVGNIFEGGMIDDY